MQTAPCDLSEGLWPRVMHDPHLCTEPNGPDPEHPVGKVVVFARDRRPAFEEPTDLPKNVGPIRDVARQKSPWSIAEHAVFVQRVPGRSVDRTLDSSVSQPRFEMAAGRLHPTGYRFGVVVGQEEEGAAREGSASVASTSRPCAFQPNDAEPVAKGPDHRLHWLDAAVVDYYDLELTNDALAGKRQQAAAEVRASVAGRHEDRRSYLQVIA